MPLHRDKVYLLSKPEAENEDDLARPGYWDWIQFDQAPFLFQGKTKLIENGNVFYKYLWAEWVVAGYIESVEHVVSEKNVQQYEDRWIIPEDVWLKTLQTILYEKMSKPLSTPATFPKGGQK